MAAVLVAVASHAVYFDFCFVCGSVDGFDCDDGVEIEIENVFDLVIFYAHVTVNASANGDEILVVSLIMLVP